MAELIEFRMNEIGLDYHHRRDDDDHLKFYQQSLTDGGSIKSRPFDPDAIKQRMYARHNDYRYLHHSPFLCWSAELAEFSQVWANKIAEKEYLQYSEHPALGENIVLIDLDECPSGEEIVDEWYKERKYYNYNKPGWSRFTYHFTQMIWRNSSEIGVGVQKFSRKNCAAVVVSYKPCGNDNLPGEYKKNVLQPRAVKKRNSCQTNF